MTVLEIDKTDLLNTPAYLPSWKFAVASHLHESAIPEFTKILADQLRAQPAANFAR
jgi:hypothetical protein